SCCRDKARANQENIFEDHPACVFKPSPLAREKSSVNRLRPVHSTDKMIGRNNDRGGNQDAPVPVKREKCQGAENMKMCLDSTAGQMNQQCGEQHLSDGDHMPR